MKGMDVNETLSVNKGKREQNSTMKLRKYKQMKI